jgi:hypothetical protein
MRVRDVVDVVERPSGDYGAVEGPDDLADSDGDPVIR